MQKQLILPTNVVLANALLVAWPVVVLANLLARLLDRLQNLRQNLPASPCPVIVQLPSKVLAILLVLAHRNLPLVLSPQQPKPVLPAMLPTVRPKATECLARLKVVFVGRL
jgi:hypothetical protein